MQSLGAAAVSLVLEWTPRALKPTTLVAALGVASVAAPEAALWASAVASLIFAWEPRRRRTGGRGGVRWQVNNRPGDLPRSWRGPTHLGRGQEYEDVRGAELFRATCLLLEVFKDPLLVFFLHGEAKALDEVLEPLESDGIIAAVLQQTKMGRVIH